MNFPTDLIHPQLMSGPLGVGDAFFPHRLAVKSLRANASSDDESSPTWTAIAGKEAIPCREGGELQKSFGDFAQHTGETKLLLNGFHPDIEKATQVKLTRKGGSTAVFSVLAVAHDSDETLTLLIVEKIT